MVFLGFWDSLRVLLEVKLVNSLKFAYFRNDRHLKRISIGYSRDAYSLPIKKSGEYMNNESIHYGYCTVLVGGVGKCFS